MGIYSDFTEIIAFARYLPVTLALQVTSGSCPLPLYYSIVSLGEPEKGLKMEIVFKRRLTNELMTTYLPSALLLLISYATVFFKPFYFEAAVTVNLSLLLVITTLFVRRVQTYL